VAFCWIDDKRLTARLRSNILPSKPGSSSSEPSSVIFDILGNQVMIDHFCSLHLVHPIILRCFVPFSTSAASAGNYISSLVYESDFNVKLKNWWYVVNKRIFALRTGVKYWWSLGHCFARIQWTWRRSSIIRIFIRFTSKIVLLIGARFFLFLGAK
jgi:hypothetical protein